MAINLALPWIPAAPDLKQIVGTGTVLLIRQKGKDVPVVGAFHAHSADFEVFLDQSGYGWYGDVEDITHYLILTQA